MNTENTNIEQWGPVTDWSRPEDIRYNGKEIAIIAMGDQLVLFKRKGEPTELSRNKRNFEFKQRPPYTPPRHIPGFRPLADGEEWRMPEKFRREDLPEGWRPLLEGEERWDSDEHRNILGSSTWLVCSKYDPNITWPQLQGTIYRTQRPLPPLPEPVNGPDYKADIARILKSMTEDELVAVLEGLGMKFEKISASAETPKPVAEAHAASSPAGGVTAGGMICDNFIEDSCVCYMDGTPKGQCIYCGFREHEHKKKVLNHIPLGPEDVPYGSQIRMGVGAPPLLVIFKNELHVTIHNDCGHINQPWRTMAENTMWQILRPGATEWVGCWKEGKP